MKISGKKQLEKEENRGEKFLVKRADLAINPLTY